MIALAIIDQQKGIDHPKLGKRNNPTAEAVMVKLLAVWRELQWPVVHIKHRSTEPNSVFWPEQSGYDFKPDFEPLAEEAVIEKSVPCAFTANRLDGLLQHWQVNQLAIVGVATNNSVESTARAGGNLGYEVYVIEDGCFTFAKVDFYGVARTAKEVHGMSLANLDGEYATVVSSQQFMQQFGMTVV